MIAISLERYLIPCAVVLSALTLFFYQVFAYYLLSFDSAFWCAVVQPECRRIVQDHTGVCKDTWNEVNLSLDVRLMNNANATGRSQI